MPIDSSGGLGCEAEHSSVRSREEEVLFEVAEGFLLVRFLEYCL